MNLKELINFYSAWNHQKTYADIVFLFLLD